MNVIEVVDVPEGASVDEARRLLNKPCEENRYMLVQMFAMPDGGTRAFYRLVARAYDKWPGERRKITDGNAEAAAKILRDNPELSIRKSVALLERSGIKRGRDWVSLKRHELQTK